MHCECAEAQLCNYEYSRLFIILMGARPTEQCGVSPRSFMTYIITISGLVIHTNNLVPVCQSAVLCITHYSRATSQLLGRRPVCSVVEPASPTHRGPQLFPHAHTIIHIYILTGTEAATKRMLLERRSVQPNWAGLWGENSGHSPSWVP